MEELQVAETLGQALEESCLKWAKREAFIFENDRLSFDCLQEGAYRFAKSLMALGIGAGEKIAIWMPGRVEWVFFEFACSLVGAIGVPLNTRFKEYEAKYVLEETEATTLFIVDRFLKIDSHEILSNMCPELEVCPSGQLRSAALPSLRNIIISSDESHQYNGTYSYEEFLSMGDRVEEEAFRTRKSARRQDEVVLIQYTSGTTSFPKGAMLTNEVLLKTSASLGVRLKFTAEDVVFSTQPFYHFGGSAGTIPIPVTVGSPVVIPEYYTPEKALKLIERERCSVRFGFATMYIMELGLPNYKDYDVSSLRTGWCVGPSEVMRRIHREMGISGIVQLYGASEGGGTLGSPEDPLELRMSSLGRAFPGTEVVILDLETGEQVAPKVVGEICCRGWYQMKGYYKRPGETWKTIDAEGWLHTGDLGKMDQEGYLYFVGRIKDMIKPGGENVATEEVESYLLSHPKIKQVAVIGVPDERLGEVPMAIVELHRGVVANEEEVIAYCKKGMANFKVPRYVQFISETDWPLTASGKIQKFALRDRFVSQTERR